MGKTGKGRLIASTVAAVTMFVPAGAADEEVLPPQCYSHEVMTGIPATYTRDAMIDQPVLQKRIEPDYPAAPSKSREFYCAAFSFAVSAEGKTTDIELLYDSHPGIDDISFGADARKALAKWQFAPGMIDKGNAQFIGFSAVFFRGFGEMAEQHALLAEEATQALVMKNDASADWRSYGRSVSQEELEALELAAERKAAPTVVKQELAKQPKKERPKFYNSWVIAEDGTILTDDGIIPANVGTIPENTVYKSAEKEEIVLGVSEGPSLTAEDVADLPFAETLPVGEGQAATAVVITEEVADAPTEAPEPAAPVQPVQQDEPEETDFPPLMPG